IGNHSHNHLNGWKTDRDAYISNVLKAETAISEYKVIENDLHQLQPAKKIYRPPYGRITPSQIRELERKDYKIVMWDVLSRDYDSKRPAEACIRSVKKYTRPGSIIVFHDSVKAFPNLRIILPEMLNFFAAKGFEFRSL